MNQTLRPVFKKTLVKGIIAVGLFSLLLDINASNILNYLIFLAASLCAVAGYAAYKHATVYTIDDGGVTLKSPLRQKTRRIEFSDIADITLSQGFLAKRFGCGSVFLVLKKGRGSYAIVGGGYAEALRDVPNPQAVYELISNMLGPNR